MEVKQLQTPALVLDLDAFDENTQRMQDYLKGSSMALRPHYKSHKCTTLAHMQIKSGAKGICCAKVSEAMDLAEAGIEDILIANQVIDPYKIAQVAYLANCCYLTVCVDHIENIDALQAAATRQNATIHCLIEYEVGMNRCGVPTPEEFYRIAEHMNQCPNLVFEGIQAYAGHLSHEVDYTKRKVESEKVETRLLALVAYLKERGISVKEVSGTSTGTIEFRPQNTIYTEVQPGSYIFMDTAYNLLNLKFKNALYVASTIISITGGFMVADAGRKSISLDQEMPVFKEYPEAAIRVSEEHSMIPVQEGRKVGDLLRLIPGHCCTTMNLHDDIYFARGNKIVDKVPITSRGKSR